MHEIFGTFILFAIIGFALCTMAGVRHQIVLKPLLELLACVVALGLLLLACVVKVLHQLVQSSKHNPRIRLVVPEDTK